MYSNNVRGTVQDTFAYYVVPILPIEVSQYLASAVIGLLKYDNVFIESLGSKPDLLP